MSLSTEPYRPKEKEEIDAQVELPFTNVHGAPMWWRILPWEAAYRQDGGTVSEEQHLQVSREQELRTFQRSA